MECLWCPNRSRSMHKGTRTISETKTEKGGILEIAILLAGGGSVHVPGRRVERGGIVRVVGRLTGNEEGVRA